VEITLPLCDGRDEDLDPHVLHLRDQVHHPHRTPCLRQVTGGCSQHLKHRAVQTRLRATRRTRSLRARCRWISATSPSVPTPFVTPLRR
jgi:hypothetical protein